MNHLLLRLLLVLTLCALSLPLRAEEPVMEIYETYMPADKLIPILQPLLGVEDKITAYHNKLMVRAPQDRQDKLLELLQEIDRPMRNLLISVRYSNQVNRDLDQTNTDIHYGSASKGVRIQGSEDVSDDNNMVVYKGSSRDDKIQARVVTKETYSTRKDDVTQQIRVLEGQQGFLQVGEERPETRYVFLSPYGAGSSTEYRQVGHGVYVIPQIVRDKIRLELYTTNQRRQPGNQQRIETTEAQSVLLVEPDVWTPFAGASATVSSNSNSIGASTRSLKQGNPGLELKVTILE
ncbi:MAG TPA: hypothetical protein VM553_00470 [Dongiaceae bacterium]|nr:hypothetical protein [Dongiaceae bacterium]